MTSADAAVCASTLTICHRVSGDEALRIIPPLQGTRPDGQVIGSITCAGSGAGTSWSAANASRGERGSQHS
jgi:hypothetical protein